MPAQAQTGRTLRIVIPFEPADDGALIGAIRIVTPAPYAGTDYYTVVVREDEATFAKDNGDKSTHVVDRDMRACDCPGYGYRRKCRHLEALAVLEAKGKI